MTHFGLDLEPSRRVLEQLFSQIAVGQDVFLLRASLLDEEVPLIDQYGSGEAIVECDWCGGEDNCVSKLRKCPGAS